MTTTMQEAKKRLFGTDGIRGIPGKHPLDDGTLVRVGQALGSFLRAHSAHPRVVIGMDTRESGPHIAGEIARGLVAAGAEPVSAGIVTTPGVAWLVRRDKFAAGVVISASHNPYHDNGVKLISSNGMKFPDATEAEIERVMEELPAGSRRSKSTLFGTVSMSSSSRCRDCLRTPAVMPGPPCSAMDRSCWCWT